ncbi:ComF family protein [Flavicella sp.]|uniref:ComF family protein n=1 Tax=Flavicella sp. TaxID=2957742 RepID=UPI00301AAA41
MIFSKFKDVLHLFYPNTCLGCNKHLSYYSTLLCVHCLHDLPYSYYSCWENNPIEQIFFGKISIQCATSLFLFQTNSSLKTLIHELKYKNNQLVGEFLGDLLLLDLSKSDQYKQLDCVIPVPLHPEKFKQRGYNQLSILGRTLSEGLSIPYMNKLLVKTNSSDTQTKMNKLDRWKNAQESFHLTDNKILENKNILLIDDVITTGATIEACVKELSKTKNISISIAAIAHTINF